LKESGLSADDVQFSKPAVTTIINSYTRESGLRGLEKQIANVCRKIARQHAEADGDDSGTVGTTDKLTIKLTPQLVQKHLGAKRYDDEFYHKDPLVGVSLGLAYTSYGGEVMAIETNLLAGKGAKLVLTGQLGDVMKESAHTALSYIRSRAVDFGLDALRLAENEIHVHVPAGAVPKDGPSAGTALATSILSALLNRAPTEKIAMTGEITLHGKVLPIGGLKEKILAAQREGIEHVLLPEKNRATFESLPQNVKRRIKVTFVKNYSEVLEIMFGVMTPATTFPTAPEVGLVAS
jgi:ATP-dependent Lon protease